MVHADELKSIAIFGCLTDAQRQRLAQTAADIHVQAGEWVIREGDVPWFYVLLEGAMDVYKRFGGTDRVVNKYNRGDFFGETPILLASPAIASLRAHEDSRLVRLDRLQFKELIDMSPECSSIILQTMAKRVAMVQEFVRNTDAARVLVVGSQYDTDCRDIRTFLAMNRIPYEWVDRDREPERVPSCMPADLSGPAVVVDRAFCVGQPPTVRKVAEALGIRTTPTKENYDVVVVGG